MTPAQNLPLFPKLQSCATTHWTPLQRKICVILPVGAEDSGKLPRRFPSHQLRWLQNYIWKLRQNWGLTPETIPFILSSFERNQSLSFPHCVLIKFPDQRESEWILLRQTARCKWLQRSNADFYLLTVDYNWQWQDKHFLCCCLAVGCDWCRERL